MTDEAISPHAYSLESADTLEEAREILEVIRNE